MTGFPGHEAEIAIEADSVGVSVVGRYPACRLKPVAVQLWYRPSSGDYEYQDTCMIARQDGDSDYMRGYCQFRRPVPSGEALVRAFNLSSDYETYGHEDGEGYKFAFKDYVTTDIRPSKTYKALSEHRLVTVEKETYKLVMEQNTGVTYEFYSKRARPTPVNAALSHQGGAIQVAIHDIDESSLGGLYWNPTQAGALCSYPSNESDPQAPVGTLVLSDYPNDGSTAKQVVTFSPFRMMSYGYGASYPGPYNPLDTMTFTQEVRTEDQFVEYDVRLCDSGKQRNVRLEIPTFYFSNPYRRFYVKNTEGKVVSVDVPRRRTSTKDYGFLHDEGREIDWITFENIDSAQNDAFTIAWSYGSELRADITKYEYWVGTEDAFNSVKFSNFPYLRTRSNVEYRAKYIIFPYRFDEVITTRYGTAPVADTIASIFEKKQ